MNCYECRTTNREAAAVAVCRVCGAGVCGGHVTIDSQSFTGIASPGKVTHDQPARAFLCPVCSRAKHEG